MCYKIVQWLLILRPRYRYLIAHQLALQVRVDGQSSSDTVKKNGSHWLEVLRNKALFNNKWEHHNYLTDNDTSTRQFLALNLAN